MDFATEQHGCEHYRRGCRVVAPCCGEVFGCRHCHNDAKNSLEVDPRDRHEIPRHEINKVICTLCSKEQDVQQNCSNCGACMGKYFCEICNFFDDDISKGQYHCHGCGICRTGGADNFFHCDTCGKFLHDIRSAMILLTVPQQGFHQLSRCLCCNLTGCCYSNVLKDSHRCVERAMHHNCPVCFEVSGLCSMVFHSIILRKEIISF
uniref:CHY-type domain-containing protein n=1 Tax=Setaria italica TaxID=4555 RepID=K4AF86_SETIT